MHWFKSWHIGPKVGALQLVQKLGIDWSIPEVDGQLFGQKMTSPGALSTPTNGGRWSSWSLMILHHLITALFVRYLKEIIAMISLISCIELFLRWHQYSHPNHRQSENDYGQVKVANDLNIAIARIRKNITQRSRWRQHCPDCPAPNSACHRWCSGA